MILVYKNPRDDNRLHFGTIISNQLLWTDVIPLGHIVTKELDWRKNHIQSVPKSDYVALLNNESLLKRAFPEEFI